MPPKLISKDVNYISPLQQLQVKNQNPNKRIRVARACDTCRRRKVKCDGKQPCIHCTVYSYECTYNHFKPPQVTNKRKKETTPTSESPPIDTAKVSASFIAAVFPEINLSDPNFNSELFLQIFNKHKKNGIIDLKATLQEYNQSGGVKIPKQVSDPVEIKIILPPREIALKLIYRTWNDSCLLFRFYHRPGFIKDFNSLYETNPNEYSNHQNKMLPLIYSVISVGALFSKGDNAIDNKYLQDEGYKYFIAARKLIDITNSTDLESIQTIFMLTLFLQCSARLSTCYSYIGIALRSALRQGLHRKLETPCNYIKRECKKRLFWTIYKMEIYVNSMLGLPNSIDEADIDAEFPMDLDDQNIEYDRIIDQPPGKLSSCGINNWHTQLILILNHIVKKLYKSSNRVFAIPNEDIKNLENELKLWLYELPYQLKPDVNCSPEYFKANKVLQLDFLHVQLMLYRPFINYVKIAKNSNDPEAFQSYQYKYGIKCFQISKEIVHLAEEMINKKLLNGSYWFSIYTIFFSVACLVYFFLEIDSKDGEVNASIEKGKQILSKLKQKSVSAERIYNLLNHMFENYDRISLKLEVLDEPIRIPEQNRSFHQQQSSQPQSEQTPSYPIKSFIPQKGPYTSSHQIQQTVPLNSYTSPNDALINLPATHTLDKIDSAATSKSTYSSSTVDDFDLKIFGNFLPSYMLQPNKVKDDEISTTSGAGALEADDTAPLKGLDKIKLDENLLDGDIIPNGYNVNLNNVSSINTELSGDGSKTDDDDGFFDWERFFDKNDGGLNFEI